jgi:aspartate-semialdehyde dehydrogenase
MKKIDVAVLGATGAVGQRFIQLLEGHPWFRVAEVVGKASAGKPYGEAVHWVLDGAPPASVADMMVKPLESELNSPIVFSALPKEAAQERELPLAAAGHVVCTNASTYRMEEDVPLLLPEANVAHLALVDEQRKVRGWSTGALVANSNCTVMPVVMSLAPLKLFGIEQVMMVSQQAVSGAGYPGVASLDILDNIVPYIGGEEEKLEIELAKMLGTLEGGRIAYHQARSSATCTRVPVTDAHLVSVSVALNAKPSLADVIQAWETYQTDEALADLPSAPKPALYYLRQADRPQPRRDRNAGNGMATSIGRLRECPILGYKFVALSHNTIRGAAGCSILNAELLVKRGYVHGVQA